MKAKLELRDRRRQAKSAESHFSKELENAKEELELKEGFLRKLAREENELKGFSGEVSKGNIGDAEPNVQKAKGETIEALKYVVPFDILTAASPRCSHHHIDLGAYNLPHAARPLLHHYRAPLYLTRLAVQSQGPLGSNGY